MELCNILLTMGLPAIDESLDALLQAMYLHPANDFFGSTYGIAKTIAYSFMFVMCSYECWMMMLGRRGMDVMRIARMIGLVICIWSSGYICSALKSPGYQLEKSAKSMAKSRNQQVAALELEVAKMQKKYYDKLVTLQDSIDKAKYVEQMGDDAGVMDKILYNVEHFKDNISNTLKNAAVIVETKFAEWFNDAIKFIGELIFQTTYYGVLLGQRIFLSILGIFAPIMFAFSILPPWSSAWSQWISKYLSISLWGFVAYLCVFYIDFILQYNLERDLKAYEYLIGTADNSWSQIGALGMQGIGSTCMHVMGLVVGAFVLRMVPEVASWLIPGGVSSGIGSSMGAAAVGGTMAAGGMAVGAASSAKGGISSSVNGAASLAGGYSAARSGGSSKMGAIAKTIVNNTSAAQSFKKGKKL